MRTFGQETLYTFNLKGLLDPLVSYSTAYLVLGRRRVKINRRSDFLYPRHLLQCEVAGALLWSPPD